MNDHDPKQTRGELIQLLNKQLGTLEKETFGGLATTERREYEVRREHIHQLYDEFTRQTVLGYEETPRSIKGFWGGGKFQICRPVSELRVPSRANPARPG
jgi:hypothetical protein